MTNQDGLHRWLSEKISMPAERALDIDSLANYPQVYRAMAIVLYANGFTEACINHYLTNIVPANEERSYNTANHHSGSRHKAPIALARQGLEDILDLASPFDTINETDQKALSAILSPQFHYHQQFLNLLHGDDPLLSHCFIIEVQGDAASVEKRELLVYHPFTNILISTAPKHPSETACAIGRQLLHNLNAEDKDVYNDAANKVLGKMFFSGTAKNARGIKEARLIQAHAVIVRARKDQTQIFETNRQSNATPGRTGTTA